MKKIVFLPLDGRPCNAKFPMMLYNTTFMRVVEPQNLGNWKTPANLEELQGFLLKECPEAEGLVISLDMLLYGGLVPSRLHDMEPAALKKQLTILREVKRRNPKLMIFAFQCIMRCPKTSSNIEEPDYYAQYGAQIHELGVARHRAALGDMDAAGKASGLENQIPESVLMDYLGRRRVNLSLNIAALDFVEEGIIDFLVFPQDDAAPYGFTAMDQEPVREAVREKRLQNRVLIYPGADELGMTLLSRMCNCISGRCPAVYALYASSGAPYVIPTYEDRPLAETVRYQILAAGCRQVSAPENADFILAITAPADNMTGSAVQPRQNRDYDVFRSLPPFFADICYWTDHGKPVTICDNAYNNGGDLELLAMLDASGRLMRMAGYSGWNTSSNTMGTAIAQGVRFLYEGADDGLRDFLALRYVEDCGYDAVVRQEVIAGLPALGLENMNVKETEGEAAALVAKGLREFIAQRLSSVEGQIRLERVRLPWRRMFEPDLTVRYISESGWKEHPRCSGRQVEEHAGGTGKRDEAHEPCRSPDGDRAVD